ncbi:RBBP9/YdeN family alpha/beta hydrolase [Aeromonas simiae]|uniref:RBBP9/YdeN family alpha/beta hydrolase n=1 Tax=Aeromonas simiae TaxID=218936 RepID=UPI0005A75F72|nr:alpha/beta fold hydrolase [Aeromonas simiae]MDO2947575.1 alpha/beta fold hydrolase [Aeromonas simiae]MDO2951265.1 alpha/beta fold hydrolase [Aeromonas simiae]MDO2955135.1 alpha/beta fold hydrolase [Aeromonas simiae]
MPRVVVIHGYTATPSANWFPWLQQQLAQQDVECLVPAMPDSHRPAAPAWDAALDAVLAAPSPDTVLVGHSLGCITALRYLERQPASVHIGGLVLVSGFSQPVPTLPELDPFMEPAYHPQRIRRQVPQRRVIAASDDDIVPFSYSQHLAWELAAPLHRVERGGHFIDRDGFTRFPLLLETLQPLLS